MVRIFKLSWLIMAVAISLICFSCGNSNDGSNSNVESNNDRITNEPANKIDKDSLDAISQLFDNAFYKEQIQYVAKENCRISDYFTIGKGDIIGYGGKESEHDGNTYKSSDSKYHYFRPYGDSPDFKIEKSKVEVKTKKIYAVSSNVLEKWTAVFENSKGETARMFKIDYNGHRIEYGYKCVLLLDNEKESSGVYFGSDDQLNDYENNVYYALNDYCTMQLENSDFSGKYYKGNKLQCNLYNEGTIGYEYGSPISFDAENKKINFSGTEYDFKGLIRNN